MSSWKKHFTTYQGTQSPISGANNRDKNSAASFQSWLPEVYTGQPNRLERYLQYDFMDQDSEINTALDTIAEFSTQIDEESQTPFTIKWNDIPTETESDVLMTVLKQWCRVNDWNRRLFNTFRNTVKYGDQPFIRDPETWKLSYVNQMDVDRVIVDEANGKEPASYVIKNLDMNFQTLTATTPGGASFQGSTVSPQSMQTRQAPQVNNATGLGSETEFMVDAKHVIHMAITDGMDQSWPFGNSVLDAIFKTYKQKELLEDSIIIYRVQRAPERRIFYIDVGDMPAHQAMGHVERVKNEIHQRRIPSKTGGGSNMMDSNYNPLCLALDTTVPLLDGRTLSIAQLITEYKDGVENWTYSCDPVTGKIVPGNITWAGITRKNTQVVKLHLNDGSSVTVTPDHKIPVLGKGFVEAKDITPTDSLISFNTREQGLASSSSDRTYTQVYDHESNSWEYTHRMVGSFFRHIHKHQEFTYLPENVGAHKTVVHHKDFDRYNNDPRNLQWMNKVDHIKYHSEQNMWQHLTVDESARIKSKISTSVKALWAAGAYDVNNIKNAQKKFVYMRNNDLEFSAKYNATLSKSRKKFLKNNPSFVENILLPNLMKWSDSIPNQTKVYTFDQLQAIYRLAENHDFKLKAVVAATDEHGQVLDAIKAANIPESGKHFKISVDRLTHQVVYNTLHHFGYDNWKDFKAKRYEFNHNVVDIEWIDELQDTGTITIDGNEVWHNHHTFPVNDSIFVKNSIMEDYFFAQTAEGRGSKVETLPGGQNLGDIDDLKFFNNKMARGLRIPSSYLPTGPDDGTATVNDGRQGTAFIQEYRFTQYCQRLQRMVQPTLEKEFKMFLKYKGYEIDSSQFTLDFVDPQSFSDYREIEINGARAGVFGQIEGVDYISKRFALKKYLQLSDSEILENEKMWKQENPIKGDQGSGVDDDEFSDMGNVGVGGGADGSLDDFEAEEDFADDDIDFGDEDGESPIAGEADDNEEEL